MNYIFMGLPISLWLSATIWIMFLVYWFRFWPTSGHSASPEAAESPASRNIHLSLFATSLAVALLARFWPLTTQWLPESPSIAVTGLLLQLCFIGFAAWARYYLGEQWSSEITAKDNHRLVAAGPYRIIRHPIYSGIIGMFIGTAITGVELHGLIGLGICVVTYVRKLRIEEKVLAVLFGPEYEAYKRRTWALIPGIF